VVQVACVLSQMIEQVYELKIGNAEVTDKAFLSQ
jgi:hypothetical protein